MRNWSSPENRVPVVIIIVLSALVLYLYVNPPVVPPSASGSASSSSSSSAAAAESATLKRENAHLRERLEFAERHAAPASGATAAAKTFATVPTNRGHITKRAAAKELPDWESRVRKPEWVEQCRKWMGIGEDGAQTAVSGSPAMESQHWQDWFVYHNYFKGTGPGFYVDVGSNDPKVISNTFFLDMCLGWDGICVEPNPQYHARYEEVGRTCKLVKHCASDVDGQEVHMSDDTTGSKISATGGLTMTCRRLDTILTEAGVKRVDVLSLDIEGHEHTVLKATNFQAFDVQLVLMETFWLNKDDTDILMASKGYSKVANLQIDDVYEYAVNAPPLHFPTHLGFDAATERYKRERDDEERKRCNKLANANHGWFRQQICS